MRMHRFGVVFALAIAGCGGSGDTTDDDPVTILYPDADADGILDMHEAGWGEEQVVEETEPTVPETNEPATGSGTASGTTGSQTEPPDYLTEDWDGDGTPNYLDLDSDDDGIEDTIESGDDNLFTLPADADLDMWPNFLDLDSDGNCVDDATEGVEDLDGDGVYDFSDLDNDGDTIKDSVEIGEDCEILDTDGDGVPNHEDEDSDGDGIADRFEGGTTPFSDEVVDTDGDGVPDYLDDDSDGDGISDADEAGDGAIWEAPRDTDGDGIYDFQDEDSDGDGLSDADEVEIYGTDPLSDDTDGDGFTDGAEVEVGVDPLDPDSVIEGIYVVVPERTDVDEVFDFILEVKMGDVAFLLDTTGSMGGTLTAMSSEFSTMVSELAVQIPDAAYGVATYDDYACCGYGDPFSGDRPFILRNQITTNTANIQSTLGVIPLHYGVDGPESTTEAIYQALTGIGYDMACSGSFDTMTDVLPFVSGPLDAFGGTAGGNYNATVAGTGINGGMGFRDYALPIIVYATDADMRNAPGSPTTATPGGCPGDAGSASVTSAAAALGAKLIGVCVNSCGGARPQMVNFANNTGSYADLDGDGLVNDPLVFDWSGSSSLFRSTVVDAITDVVDTVSFNEITLDVQNDIEGFVVNIDPPVHYVAGAASGQQIPFTLTFRGADTASTEDELHQLTLNVVGDGAVLLDTMDIFVLVPGSEVQ